MRARNLLYYFNRSDTKNELSRSHIPAFSLEYSGPTYSNYTDLLLYTPGSKMALSYRRIKSTDNFFSSAEIKDVRSFNSTAETRPRGVELRQADGEFELYDFRTCLGLQQMFPSAVKNKGQITELLLNSSHRIKSKSFNGIISTSVKTEHDGIETFPTDLASSVAEGSCWPLAGTRPI